MEKTGSFVNNEAAGGGGGGLSKLHKLPVGFRFLPTDEEILVHYLRKKVSSAGQFLGSSVIPEFDVFQTDPWNFPGDPREKRYFFSRKNVNQNQDNKKIAINSGFWKTIGKRKHILAVSGNIKVTGSRKTLAFHNHCSNGGGTKLRWMLHEISLMGNLGAGQPGSEDRDWAVYRLFSRKARSRKKNNVNLPYNFTPASPCSISITESSRFGASDKEESSSSSPFFRE